LNNDLVTVAIPAYNHQDYVQETIYSIINQTHQNIELVIFNDGSTDNTDTKIKEVLPECRKRFARLEYISKENEGLATTWNRAIDWAHSDYLYTIASDDVAMPQAVEVLYEFLSKHNEYALAVGDNQIINDKGERCYWDKRRNNTTIEHAVFHTFGEFLKKGRAGRRRYKPRNYGTYKTLIRGNYITNGKMFRIQSLIRVGKFIPGMKVEDWYINLQLAKHYRMKYMDEILLSYRWHGNNTIRNPAYVADCDIKVLDYEKENHRIWFEKYAGKKCARELGNKLTWARDAFAEIVTSTLDRLSLLKKLK
jgi:alpha-1,3-rhamnosyltransferase